MNGLYFLAIVAVVIFTVFLCVLGVVCMAKIVQIAEDLRYIRSKSDLSVSRPRTTKNTLTVCTIAACIVVLVVIGFMLALANSAGLH